MTIFQAQCFTYALNVLLVWFIMIYFSSERLDRVFSCWVFLSFFLILCVCGSNEYVYSGWDKKLQEESGWFTKHVPLRKDC